MVQSNKTIVCSDGFEMSVQASEFTYCTPRVDGAEKYTAVEIGFPNMREELIIAWAENPNKPTDTVYGYVPSERISLVCAKHGGIVSGELPPGIHFLRAGKGWAWSK
jgi:hypothetical protein